MLTAASLFLSPAASPCGQRDQQPLRLDQVRCETGAGLRVPDEQGPPPVGHHHQPAGKKMGEPRFSLAKKSVPPVITDDISFGDSRPL